MDNIVEKLWIIFERGNCSCICTRANKQPIYLLYHNCCFKNGTLMIICHNNIYHWQTELQASIYHRYIALSAIYHGPVKMVSSLHAELSKEPFYLFIYLFIFPFFPSSLPLSSQIHLISPGCPWPNSALTVQKSGLKHRSSIHPSISSPAPSSNFH